MKVLAVSSNTGDPAPHISDEMRRIAELQAAGVIEQLYLKADHSGAAIVRETQSGEEAERELARGTSVLDGDGVLRRHHCCGPDARQGAGDL